jgi:SpoVK/Ycf46/Vps4 family AAA+-type ATPase
MKSQEEKLINSVQNLSINSKHPHKSITSTISTKSASTLPSSLTGMDDVLDALREAIIWPHLYHQQGASLGISWPRGLLLHGPPGTGKSSAVAAVAKECNASIHTITAASIFGAFTGQSERRLREVFEAAQLEAESEGNNHPVIIFIDEIDALCPKRDSKRQHEARVVAQLLTLMDGAATSSGNNKGGGGGQIPSSSSSSHIVVIAATNRPNAIDPALRRAGRFDREVSVNIPLLPSRLAILERLVEKMPLAGDVDLHNIAAKCHGYTGADLSALCREAAMKAINSTNKMLMLDSTTGNGNAVLVKMGDFMGAMSKVGPSIARGVAVDFIPIQWDDIGGLEDVKLKIKQAVEWPLKHADAFERLGLTAPRGVLLHGPPGCSKTTLARAAATASGATFVSLSGAQVYSMYLGEGEALLRDAFKRARLSAPSIIFLDELDSIVGKREHSNSGGNSGSGSGLSESGSRILSTLLTEMDGLELAQGVLVMGATNRPTALDAALLRPGRFDIALFVPPPDYQGRIAALKFHSRKMPLGEDVDFEEMARGTEMFTGAELAAVCREAALSALREDPGAARAVCARHFEDALRGSTPLLDEKLLEKYASWPGDR